MARSEALRSGLERLMGHNRLLISAPLKAPYRAPARPSEGWSVIMHPVRSTVPTLPRCLRVATTFQPGLLL